jgi:hypothetical protein
MSENPATGLTSITASNSVVAACPELAGLRIARSLWRTK